MSIKGLRITTAEHDDGGSGDIEISDISTHLFYLKELPVYLKCNLTMQIMMTYYDTKLHCVQEKKVPLIFLL